MAFLQSISRVVPKHTINPTQSRTLASSLFQDSDLHLDRLLPIFENAGIDTRYIVKEPEWYKENRSFPDKNNEFLNLSLELGTKAISECLESANKSPKDVDILVVVTSSGFITPTLDARLMGKLGFSPKTIRVPLTGFGCAGGAIGLSRANEFANLYSQKNVLLLAVETCTLTFRPSDKRKANLVALSLFADGASAVLLSSNSKSGSIEFLGSESHLWEDSLNVMGWDVMDDGLQVIFDKSIPSLIERDYKPVFDNFLDKFGLNKDEIKHFLYHPGGRKVLESLESSLHIPRDSFSHSYNILRYFGNMSSPTLLFVLAEFLDKNKFAANELGVLGAMGPGFSSEIVLFQTT